MITKFTNYINESRKSIDELEVLTPDQLGELLIAEVSEDGDEYVPDLQYIQDLLDVGCPIDYKSKYGITALHYAAMNGYLEVVKFFVYMGSDVNIKTDIDLTALHFAVQDGNLETVKLLLSSGADINARDESYRTPLHLAGENGSSSMMKFLISKGADDNARDICGRSADNSLDDWMDENDENGILESREAIDDLEMLNPGELGELLIAEVQRDSPDVQYIEDILTVGCPIDAKNDFGRTAIHQAAWNGNIEMVEFLISRGADIHARDNWGRTPLHVAALYGELKMIEFLLSIGADINVKDNAGWTPLCLAGMGEKIETIKFLISRGVQVDARADDGRTTWDFVNHAIRKAVPELNPNK